MGNEGQENTKSVVNETRQHPWEVFPTDNSGARKKNSEPTEAELEKQRLKREKKIARKNSRHLWIKKHKLLTALFVILFIAANVGLVFLIVFLTRPEEKPVEAIPDGEKPLNLRQYSFENIPTGEALIAKLDSEEKNKIVDDIFADKGVNCAKILDNGSALIKSKGDISKEDKITYNLYVYYVATEYNCLNEVYEFLQDFDGQKLKLNNNQEYMHSYMEYIVNRLVGDKKVSEQYYQKWLEIVDNDNNYYYNDQTGEFEKSNSDGE